MNLKSPLNCVSSHIKNCTQLFEFVFKIYNNDKSRLSP